MRENIYTSQQTYEELHRAADGRGEMTRVSKQALLHLLMDHGTLVGVAKSAGVELVEAKRADA